MEYFLDNGVNVDYMYGSRSFSPGRLTPLISACQAGQLLMCRLLVERGADLRAVINEGTAYQCKAIDIVDTIVQTDDHGSFRLFTDKLLKQM